MGPGRELEAASLWVPGLKITWIMVRTWAWLKLDCWLEQDWYPSLKRRGTIVIEVGVRSEMPEAVRWVLTELTN
jgi:hypothetical protein